MIKLTLNPDFHPSEHVFHKKMVLIGSSQSKNVDLGLSDHQLQEVHIKIVEQNGKFYVFNEANDPFVSLNERPFGKKEIKTGDYLCIRDDTLLFEGCIQGGGSELSKDKQTDNKSSCKNDLILRNKQILISFFSVLLVILFLFTGIIYLKISEKNEIDELRAAKSVADVAMGLTYAKLHHENSQKMNVTDPVFLNQMIQSVVKNPLSVPTSIDLLCQFCDVPYSVRIYASSELDYFLIIAQPNPNFLHWLLQKKAIVIESLNMELRRTAKLSDLNRQLVNFDAYTGNKAEEIAAFVKEEELISLSLLSRDKNLGFLVPSELNQKDPGSENRVYNAPRYYGMTEELIERSLYVLEHAQNGKEIGIIRSQLEVLSVYRGLVFYSSKGGERAYQGLNAFSTIAPNLTFLVGYFDVIKKGCIVKPQLVSFLPKTIEIPILDESVAFNAETKKIEPMEDEQEEVDALSTVDVNHPLYLILNSLKIARQQAMFLESEPIMKLLKLHVHIPQKHFFEQLQKHLNNYRNIEQEESVKLVDQLILLSEKFSFLPFAEFYNFVKEVGLDVYLDDYKESREDDPLMSDELELKLKQVQFAEDLKKLDEIVSELSQSLSLRNITDYVKLILYQNEMKEFVMQKLSFFFIHKRDQLPPFAVDESGKDLLVRIFKSSWINDAEIIDYYINEYEHLLNDRSSGS